MARNVSSVSFGEAKARSTAWAVTFGDMVTLLLTFFILVIVMMNEAEKHVDRIINMLLDETYKELNSELQSETIKVERVTKGVKITIASGQLFPSGEAELRSEVIPTVEQIALLIKDSRITRLQEDIQFRPFVQAIEKREMIGQIYELGGVDNVSWKSMIKIVSKAAGKKKWSIPAPVMGVKALATLLDRFSWFPVTRAQLTMLMEDNTCNSKNLFQTLEMEPKIFNVEALEYLQSNND